MLLLLLKSLAMISLPILAAVYWQRRTRVPWTGAFAALAAIMIYTLIRIPLFNTFSTRTTLLPEPLHNLLPIIHRKTIISYLYKTTPLIYGAARESTRWLIMRYPAAKMTTWQEGVLFGLTYAAGAAVFSLLNKLKWHAFQAASSLETIDVTDPNLSEFDIVTSLKDAPLDLVVAELTDNIPWIVVPSFALDWSIVPIAFNVGTALAVLYGVRQQKLWPVLIAITCHAIKRETELYLQSVLTLRNLIELLRSYEFLAILSDWIGNDATIVLTIAMNPLLYILPSLPGIALLIYFRRALIHSQPEKTS